MQGSKRSTPTHDFEPTAFACPVTIDTFFSHLSSPTGTYLEDEATDATLHDNMDEDCTSCPASTYGPTTGATSIGACIGCPSGKTSVERSEACFECGE